MKKTTLSPAPLNLMTTLYQYIKLCCKHRGRVCDPSADFSTDGDDLESLPDSRSPDALINQTWRFRKGKSGNGVSPSMSPIPANDTRTSLNRQKSLQDIVSWGDVRQKFWMAKGVNMSTELDGVGYSLSNEKERQNQKMEKPNGNQYAYNNGGANFSSFDMTTNTTLPGEAMDPHDIIS